VSFALYGLLKKRVGASLPALHGLTVETAVLLPVALVLLARRQGADLARRAQRYRGPPSDSAGGTRAAGPDRAGHRGAPAAVRLGGRRVPLVTIGLLQFITPVMQLLCSSSSARVDHAGPLGRLRHRVGGPGGAQRRLTHPAQAVGLWSGRDRLTAD
jgi:hypothetical protein